jgi:hypothetical protein
MELLTKITEIFLLAFFTFLTTCNTTEPSEDNVQPGRRNYVWEIDTLTAQSNLFYLFSLWGSSPTNLWAVGHADASLNSLWNYNGNSWVKSGESLTSNLQSIFGFNASNIWICDSPGGNIFHFDGTGWKNNGYFPYPEYSLTYFNNIWGPEPNEIYIAGSAYDEIKGSQAILLKYDGTKWEYINLPKKNVSLLRVRKSLDNKNLYFTAVEFSPTGDVYKLIKYDENVFDEIYSGAEVASVNEMNGKIYLAIGQKIFKHENNSPILWKDFTNTQYAGALYGRSEKDFFSLGKNGQLMHYNGTDLQVLYETNLTIFDVAVFEEDIFILCLGNSPVVIHGMLKRE